MGKWTCPNCGVADDFIVYGIGYPVGDDEIKKVRCNRCGYREETDENTTDISDR